jgi:hypothetical protein
MYLRIWATQPQFCIPQLVLPAQPTVAGSIAYQPHPCAGHHQGYSSPYTPPPIILGGIAPPYTPAPLTLLLTLTLIRS